MAQIYLRDQSFSSPEYAMQCTDFVLDWAYDDYQSQYAGADFMIYPPDNSTRWYVGLRAYGQKLSYSKTEDGQSYRYDLVPDLEFGPSFLPDLQLGVNIKKPVSPSPFSNVEYIGMTEITATSDNQPDDWVQNCRTHYYYKSNNLLVPNTGTAWVVDRVYYKIPNKTMQTYYVNFGSKDFKFSVATRISSNPSQGVYSGCLANGLNNETIGDTVDYSYNFHEGTDTPLVPNLIPGKVQWTYKTSIDANSTSIFCQTYPVHFTLSAGKTYRSRAMDGTTYSSSYNPTKDVPMFGVLTVYFDNDGLPGSWHITAMSSDVWKSAQMRKQDMGEDTKPAGGQGPQKIGKFDPLGTLTKASGSGGALTNPLNSQGFVIYKMNSTQFNSFMEKVYSEASLPTWSVGFMDKIGSLTGIGGFLDPSIAAMSTSVKSGLANTEDIIFVKNSPIEFDSTPFTLSKLSVGVFGIPYSTPETFQVVTDVTKFFNYQFDYDNNANTFTDLEPYKAASIYFPLAGECQIMPSYLENAHIHVRGGFNLLNDGAAYVCSINGDNGYIKLSKSGQCAKQADFVITKNYIGEALGKLIPTAALGAATIATGGTTAPALATTAVGSATGFVQDATNMSVVNVPNSSTGNAYDECTYGGLKNIYLTSVKAERFASGETVVGGEKTNRRAKVQGYYSYYFIDSIGEMPFGEYASFTDVNMAMQDGMTKAEYDKIISYLKEGVYI